ncbi:MAG TPA: sulfite exporter TauE/SafE family protein, partial [Candidatus Bathyarchaeota archaeon]|nr:sulfite exporter TauE/SafE family protein [Candidatus Bathyarchaeota archaeon]
MNEGINMDTSLLIGIVSIFFIALLMSMVGRGGGNFYVPVLVFLGLEIHQAATTGQFILIAAAVASALIYNKHRILD